MLHNVHGVPLQHGVAIEMLLPDQCVDRAGPAINHFQQVEARGAIFW
jgi:hypothetical protein